MSLISTKHELTNEEIKDQDEEPRAKPAELGVSAH